MRESLETLLEDYFTVLKAEDGEEALRTLRKEDVESIFKQYYRGQNAHAAAATGTGLGLFVSKKIMRGMNGDLRLESHENPTELVVDLPKIYERSIS